MTLDPEIRAALKANPSEILADQFSLHHTKLWRLVNFRLDPVLAGRVDPDDVMQEAWMAAAQRIDHFLSNPTLSVFVWLRLIVVQTLVDVQRRHLGAKMRDAYREQSLAQPANVALSAGTSVSLARRLMGNFTSPSGAAIRQEQADKLRQAIDEMDSIDREVLALRHFEELSNSETAEVLGIQQKAASIRYVRAMRRLKDILQSLPGFAENH